MVDNVSLSTQDEYATDRMIDYKSNQRVSLLGKGERYNAMHRSRDATDNDTTAESEFQSPLRTNKFYFGENNLSATIPRFSSAQATAPGISIPEGNRMRRLVPSVGGRLNISNIPILDSGSDRSSPNDSNPSDEEKGSSSRSVSRSKSGEQLIQFSWSRCGCCVN